jgi:hypothetical protein
VSFTIWFGPTFTNAKPATPRIAPLMKPIVGVWLWQNSEKRMRVSTFGVAAPVNTCMAPRVVSCHVTRITEDRDITKEERRER